MERSKQRRRDASAWREVLERFASSGLKVPAFCEREGISEGSLYRWRCILQRSAGKKRAPIVMASEAPMTSKPFVDLGALASGSSPVELRLDLGGGVLLQLVRG